MNFRLNKFMIKYKIKILMINLTILVFFILDRFLKKLALKGFSTKFFILEKNLFLIFKLSLPPLLVSILIIIILFVLFLFLFRAYQKKAPFFIFSFSLIILGALNNLIDWIFYSYIIDYVALPFLPIFNLGDLMIVGGIGMLVKKILKSDELEI